MRPAARIDMHSHYFPDKYYSLLKKYDITHPDNVFVPKWSLEDHLRKMEKANIIYTALSITSPFFSFVDPSELAQAVRECNEEGSRIVGMKNNTVVDFPIEEAVNMKHQHVHGLRDLIDILQ